MSDRRTEPRFAADQPVTVSLLTSIPGKIDDASKFGIRVTVSIPLKTGAFIEVKWDRVIVVGRVRYCRQTGPSSYCVGLKIKEVVGRGKLLQIKPNCGVIAAAETNLE
jgi:hypothetical protein